MRDDDGALDGEADAEAGEDLVTYPLRGGGVEVEGVDQSRADGGECAAGDEDVYVVTEHAYEDPRSDGGDGGSDDHSQIPNPAFRRRDAADDLEVDGEVVQQDEEGAAEEGGVEHRDPDCAFAQETADDHAALAEVVFYPDEDEDAEAEGDEGADDGAGGPGLCDAAPLQGEDVADDADEDDEVAEGVHLEELLAQGGRGGDGGRGSLEEEEDDDCGYASDGAGRC